ncbi:hypothetical protein BD289DRAFT_442650 [Coniella lustricola]|uniref:Uncharacterized protein n=1 Tax=Coniella lustricola TaxID=2025994 RepID=A0A2T2ZY04_9PEZI|nr:hypothetical protein BD289DRAFT_442650 [Coniella lustricola]
MHLTSLPLLIHCSVRYLHFSLPCTLSSPFLLRLPVHFVLSPLLHSHLAGSLCHRPISVLLPSCLLCCAVALIMMVSLFPFFPMFVSTFMRRRGLCGCSMCLFSVSVFLLFFWFGFHNTSVGGTWPGLVGLTYLAAHWWGAGNTMMGRLLLGL